MTFPSDAHELGKVVLFSAGHDFCGKVLRLWHLCQFINIPSGTLRTFVGSCGEDTGWVDDGSVAVVGVTVVFRLGVGQPSGKH